MPYNTPKRDAFTLYAIGAYERPNIAKPPQKYKVECVADLYRAIPHFHTPAELYDIDREDDGTPLLAADCELQPFCERSFRSSDCLIYAVINDGVADEALWVTQQTIKNAFEGAHFYLVELDERHRFPTSNPTPAGAGQYVVYFPIRAIYSYRQYMALVNATASILEGLIPLCNSDASVTGRFWGEITEHIPTDDATVEDYAADFIRDRILAGYYAKGGQQPRGLNTFERRIDDLDVLQGDTSRANTALEFLNWQEDDGERIPLHDYIIDDIGAPMDYYETAERARRRAEERTEEFDDE